MTEFNQSDRELAAAIRETLVRKSQQHDPLLEAALAATRAKIAAKKHAIPRWWWFGGLALAASLAVMVVVPYSTPSQEVSTHTASIAPMPSADLQLLESMDELVVMR